MRFSTRHDGFQNRGKVNENSKANVIKKGSNEHNNNFARILHVRHNFWFVFLS